MIVEVQSRGASRPVSECNPEWATPHTPNQITASSGAYLFAVRCVRWPEEQAARTDSQADHHVDVIADPARLRDLDPAVLK
jgi:hypothetical protein